MAKNKEASGNGFIDVIIYGMMIVAVVYVIIQCILGNNDALHFKLTLGIWIVVAVAVADFIGPVIMGRFNDLSLKSAKLYTVYALMDALVYMSFYVFVININMTKEPIHYIFLGIAVVLLAVKALVHNKYKRVIQETVVADMIDKEDDDSAEADTLSEDEPDDIKIIVYRNK